MDDQYVARSFFELHVEMTKRYELVASLPNAEQAVAWCAEHPVDLVIMDVVMKYGLDGLTCARTIKRDHPQIKIILTTSMAEDKWIEKAKKSKILKRSVSTADYSKLLFGFLNRFSKLI